MDLGALIDQYGLAFVAVGAFVEGDAVALSAGLLEQRGLVPFWPAVLAVAAGGWIWDLSVFVAGRGFRANPRVARALAHPRATRVTRRLLGRPVLLAALFRFVPGSRTVAPLALAAASAIRVPVYAAITAVAALCWATLLVALGHDLGHAVEAVAGRLGGVWPVLGLLTLIATALAARFAWRRARRA